MPLKAIPAISVIIPMYNAEKYIGECLDSILNQTFTDYEVIVVDDCSTDHSCEIVETYLPKFHRGGVSEKLQLVRLSKNSGAPGIPNNVGLGISRGEYISFLEADDAITNTAFEELYPIAKKFDADVVHCERYFRFDDKIENAFLFGGSSVSEPTLITENLDERLQDLYNGKFILNLWTKLIRRDFIIKNKLQMINANTHDANYTYSLVCSAKNYVRVPNAVNFYRIVPDSLSHKVEDVPKTIKKWINGLTKGFNYLDNFLSEREFFQKRPDLKHFLLEIWVRECCQYKVGLFAQVHPFQVDGIIRHEFEQVADKTALMAFIFSRMNVFNLQSMQQNHVIQQMNEHIQKQNQVIAQLQQELTTLTTVNQ